jgi:hypothetical protein
MHPPSAEKSIAWKYGPFMRRLNLLFIVALISLLCACTHYLPPPGTITSLNQHDWYEKFAPDVEMMDEGVACLESPEDQRDYVKARSIFDKLIKTYPNSKWRRLAETLMHLIDQKHTLVEKETLLSKARADGAALLQENEKLKKEIVALNDKIKADSVKLAELAKLAEENEQLKKDIKLLKNLEIELEKRDKTLR